MITTLEEFLLESTPLSPEEIENLEIDSSRKIPGLWSMDRRGRMVPEDEEAEHYRRTHKRPFSGTFTIFERSESDDKEIQS